MEKQPKNHIEVSAASSFQPEETNDHLMNSREENITVILFAAGLDMAQKVLGALTRTAVGRQELENNLAALLKTKDFLLIQCKHLFLENCSIKKQLITCHL